MEHTFHDPMFDGLCHEDRKEFMLSLASLLDDECILCGEPPVDELDVTREDLRRYFHMPINDAAKAMGRGRDFVKAMYQKHFQKNNKPPWPYRRLHTLHTVLNERNRHVRAAMDAAFAGRDLEKAVRREIQRVMDNPGATQARWVKPVLKAMRAARP